VGTPVVTRFGKRGTFVREWNPVIWVVADLVGNTFNVERHNVHRLSYVYEGLRARDYLAASWLYPRIEKSLLKQLLLDIAIADSEGDYLR
jgi:hypothetical protein